MMVDRRQKLLDKDVVILLTTDANLREFPWKWDERSNEELLEYDEVAKKRKAESIRNIIENIKGSQDWLDLIVKKAAERGISVDSMLKVDATYIYETNRDRFK